MTDTLGDHLLQTLQTLLLVQVKTNVQLFRRIDIIQSKQMNDITT